VNWKKKNLRRGSDGGSARIPSRENRDLIDIKTMTRSELKKPMAVREEGGKNEKTTMITTTTKRQER